MGLWHTGGLRFGGEEKMEAACGHLGFRGTSSSSFRFLPPTLHLLVVAPVGAGTRWCAHPLGAVGTHWCGRHPLVRISL